MRHIDAICRSLPFMLVSRPDSPGRYARAEWVTPQAQVQRAVRAVPSRPDLACRRRLRQVGTATRGDWHRCAGGRAEMSPLTAGSPIPPGLERPVARPAAPVDRSRRRRLTVEVLIVLGIFPFPYVVNALAALIQAAVGEGSTGRFPIPISSHAGLSFLLDMLLALEPLAAAALVLYLLWISGEGGSRAIGLDRSDPKQDLALSASRCSCSAFSCPSSGSPCCFNQSTSGRLPRRARACPGTSRLSEPPTPSQLGSSRRSWSLDSWYGDWSSAASGSAAIVTVAVLVRMSYHVYYGWGFLPIAAWALASVLMYRRYRRLAPFIVVHALWDLGLILIPFFGGGPVAVETLLLAPSTFVFWLMWRNRLATRPEKPRSARGWPAR